MRDSTSNTSENDSHSQPPGFDIGPSTMMMGDVAAHRFRELQDRVDHLEEMIRTLERYFHDRMKGHLEVSHSLSYDYPGADTGRGD